MVQTYDIGQIGANPGVYSNSIPRTQESWPGGTHIHNNQQVTLRSLKPFRFRGFPESDFPFPLTPENNSREKGENSNQKFQQPFGLVPKVPGQCAIDLKARLDKTNRLSWKTWRRKGAEPNTRGEAPWRT